MILKEIKEKLRKKKLGKISKRRLQADKRKWNEKLCKELQII